MKRESISLIIIFVALISCKSLPQQEELPNCIKDRIETLKIQPIQNPPSEVWKWEANGKSFYYFNAPCCDQYSTLYNNECEIVCGPDGGFTGKGDGKCPEFSEDISKTLIWKDERKVSK